MAQPQQPATLAKITKTGWKRLATVDQSDPDEVVKILREVLEQLDQIEESQQQ